MLSLEQAILMSLSVVAAYSAVLGVLAWGVHRWADPKRIQRKR